MYSFNKEPVRRARERRAPVPGQIEEPRRSRARSERLCIRLIEEQIRRARERRAPGPGARSPRLCIRLIKNQLEERGLLPEIGEPALGPPILFRAVFRSHVLLLCDSSRVRTNLGLWPSGRRGLPFRPASGAACPPAASRGGDRAHVSAPRARRLHPRRNRVVDR